jgi:hypothetical protein
MNINYIRSAVWIATISAAAALPCRAANVAVWLNPDSTTGDYFGTITVGGSNTGTASLASWAFPSQTADETYIVPGTGDTVTMDLDISAVAPGELYISGIEGVDSTDVTLGGTTYGTGGPGSTYAGLDGSASTYIPPTSLLTVDAGFFVPMSWDGNSALWSGDWQVKWTYTDPPPPGAVVPDMASTFGLLTFALGGLIGGGRHLARKLQVHA